MYIKLLGKVFTGAFFRRAEGFLLFYNASIVKCNLSFHDNERRGNISFLQIGLQHESLFFLADQITLLAMKAMRQSTTVNIPFFNTNYSHISSIDLVR